MERRWGDDADDERDESADSGDESAGDEAENDEAQAKFVEETRLEWSQLGARDAQIRDEAAAGVLDVAKRLGIDDLSSDDEPPGNTIGRVPLHWYEGYDHIGYDVAGEKVVPEPRLSALDLALAESEGGGWMVYDKLNGRNVTLTAREVETVKRLQGGAFGNSETEMYPDYVDYISSQIEPTSLYANQYEPKRRFVPSKWEAMRVKKLVLGLKSGRFLTRAALEAKKADDKDPDKLFRAYAESLWADNDEEEQRHKGPMHISAPRAQPPGHAESYNPPEEYLDEAQVGFVPRKHSSLRAVPAYEGYVKDRFERCLDLYLCPRAFKRRLNIDPESLVPQLPKPAELKPFPNQLSRVYPSDDASATPVAVSCSPDGQWLATVDDAAVVRIYEVATARCVHRRELGSAALPVAAASWNPQKQHHVLAVACGDGVHFVDCSTARGDDAAVTEALLGGVVREDEASDETVAEWTAFPAPTLKASKDAALADRLLAKLPSACVTVAWHHGGDYAVSVSPGGASAGQVAVHRLSRRESQAPLKRAGDKGGSAQTACFHPSKPFLLVATRTAVRLFHLTQQKLVKTLISGCKWISTIDVHPSGDHVLVGSCDRRVCWFDLDLGNNAYKTLKYHSKALRGVKFHKRYPLMASCADDGLVHIFHAMVYSDLMRSPLIVPVKKLDAHAPNRQNLGALAIDFHPTQPWLFSCGGDKQVRLYHAA
ncbi:NUC169 domain-containing protein [Pelagophyceae sp. CCMP2097]|nr:NUC169 domain-containing protein [Pelagophyceae sp. CCMP2097]